jgi:hypothetical protein
MRTPPPQPCALLCPPALLTRLLHLGRLEPPQSDAAALALLRLLGHEVAPGAHARVASLLPLHSRVQQGAAQHVSPNAQRSAIQQGTARATHTLPQRSVAVQHSAAAQSAVAVGCGRPRGGSPGHAAITPMRNHSGHPHRTAPQPRSPMFTAPPCPRGGPLLLLRTFFSWSRFFLASSFVALCSSLARSVSAAICARRRCVGPVVWAWWCGWVAGVARQRALRATSAHELRPPVATTWRQPRA